MTYILWILRRKNSFMLIVRLNHTKHVMFYLQYLFRLFVKFSAPLAISYKHLPRVNKGYLFILFYFTLKRRSSVCWKPRKLRPNFCHILATLMAVYFLTTNQITWNREILICFQQRWGQTRRFWILWRKTFLEIGKIATFSNLPKHPLCWKLFPSCSEKFQGNTSMFLSLRRRSV